jgi:Holliday junction resolvase
MPIDSRAKGARFERAVAKFLSEQLGATVERNLDQSRRAGTDLVTAPGSKVNLDHIAFECKHLDRSALPSWWAQAVSNSNVGQTPVLAFKIGRRPRQWVVPLALVHGGNVDNMGDSTLAPVWHDLVPGVTLSDAAAIKFLRRRG